METFFCDEDYAAYLRLLSERCKRWDVEVSAYCLMPNYVRLFHGYHILFGHGPEQAFCILLSRRRFPFANCGTRLMDHARGDINRAITVRRLVDLMLQGFSLD